MAGSPYIDVATAVNSGLGSPPALTMDKIAMQSVRPIRARMPKALLSGQKGRRKTKSTTNIAFAPGTRVLLADQWVETGGTMDGAVRLVERQKGVVAGMVAIAIEENERTANYRTSFPCISAVVPGSKWQTECNAQTQSSFDSYRPEMAFPC